LAARFIQLKLVAPVLAGLALLITGLAAIPYYGVETVDADARSQQETLVERNVAMWIGDVEFSLTAWTIWDEAIAKLDNSFDRDWADRNIGASLIGTSRTRSMMVLDRDNAVIYTRTDDTVKDLPFFARGTDAFVRDAGKLVAQVREQEQHRPEKAGIPAPIAISHIEAIGDEAVLLTASLFQPDFGTARPLASRAPILVTAMPIGGTLQEFFGKRFLLDDPRITPLAAVTADRARAEIAVSPEGEVEVLSWRPPTPAADLVHQSLPLIIAVVGVLMVGAAAFVRISQAAASNLVGQEQQMRHAATHDFLTGLSNRSALQDNFAALSREGPFVVACLDLDGFKAVNDVHGHAAGDEVLKTVADRLRSGTRQIDRLFRLGGDEFAIFMPGISVLDAEVACHKLSQSLASPMQLLNCEATVGASFGLSEVNSAGADCDAALRYADAALYQAKSLGRGGVISASIPPARLLRVGRSS
jgi:diguanylate cyclase (GGDEF)-like protein